MCSRDLQYSLAASAFYLLQIGSFMVQFPLKAGRAQYDFGTMSDFAHFQLSESLDSQLPGPSCVVKTPDDNHTMAYEATEPCYWHVCTTSDPPHP
jgi:hypothetical protein